MQPMGLFAYFLAIICVWYVCELEISSVKKLLFFVCKYGCHFFHDTLLIFWFLQGVIYSKDFLLITVKDLLFPAKLIDISLKWRKKFMSIYVITVLDWMSIYLILVWSNTKFILDLLIYITIFSSDFSMKKLVEFSIVNIVITKKVL